MGQDHRGGNGFFQKSPTVEKDPLGRKSKEGRNEILGGGSEKKTFVLKKEKHRW